MPRKRFKPGQKVPKSGQVERIGRRGGRKGTEATVVEGEPFPPTPNPGESWEYVDVTKHKKNK